MKLNTIQLSEIRVFLYQMPRYRETYFELYDHVVNALEESERPFNTELLMQIVEEDFGGFRGIVKQEALYQKSVTSNYTRLLLNEMLRSFSNSTLLSHLMILFVGFCLYSSSINSEVNLKPITYSLLILSCIPGLFYFFKRFILDRHKYKVSIKYDFLHKCMILGFLATNFLNALFISESSLFPITYHQKVIVLIVMMVGLNMYIRSFKKVYNKRIKILAV